MGLLSIFSKSDDARLTKLPSGSFTLDRGGRLLVSTLPRSFPNAEALAIGKQMLAAFQTAKAAQLPLNELIVHFTTLKLVAREMSGGAIIFLVPQALDRN